MTEPATVSVEASVDHRCEIEDDWIGPVRILRVFGRLDWATADWFRDVMREDTTDLTVIVNLDRAQLDAAVTGVVMASSARAKERGQRLVFVVTNPVELDVLESLGLPFTAPVVKSERKALALVGVR